MRVRVFSFLMICGLLASLWATGGITADVDDLPSLIFVKQTPVDFTGATIADIFNNVAGETPRLAQPVGGGLFRLDADGTLTDLTPIENIAVRDPEISYDGAKVLFSMKRGATGLWQLYEMNVDGSDMRQVYRSQSNDWDANYLPDGRIIFVSDRLDRIALANENLPDEHLPEGKLFIMDADGRNLQSVNVHPHGTFNPFLSQSGQLVFTQWDLNDLRPSATAPADGISYSRFLIWESMTDGSREGHPIFGSHLIADFGGGFMEARELSDGDMIATLTRPQDTYGAGSIVRFTTRGNPDLESYTFLTSDAGYENNADNTAGRYRSPYPLSDGRIISSYAAGAVWTGTAPDFELVMLNDEGSHETIYNDPDFWDWQAVEVAPRPMPDVIAPITLPDVRYAVINTMDVTLRNQNAGQVINGDAQPLIAPGEAANVVFYELGRPPAPYAGGDPTEQDATRRYLGTVPVEEDGSFAAIVPARAMIIWDIVDADDNVLVSERVWQEFAPGEVRQCGGCHTPPDASAGRTSNLALQNPVNLTRFNVDTDEDGTVDAIMHYLSQLDNR